MSDRVRQIEPSALAISSEPQAFHLVMVAGEMDGSNAHDLEDELIRLGNDGCSEIVVNLSQLEFIDSTGLAVLLRAHRRTRANDHSLTIVRPHGQVANAFELSGMDEVLSFVD
jgi:anti-sigma B factor antagonist